MRVDYSCWYASNKFDNAASVHPHRRAVSYTPHNVIIGFVALTKLS